MSKVPWSIRAKVQGALMGACVGDALGMPVEIWPHKKVMMLNDGRGVIGFMAPPEKRPWDPPTVAAGDTTDDWQLTKVVAESLILSGGIFNQAICAEEHVKALKNTTFGWGKTTQDSIEAIARGERDLSQPPAGNGFGNGVIMKVAPLAIANFLRKRSEYYLWDDCYALGMITHPDIRASIGAYAVALVMRRVLIMDGINYRMLDTFGQSLDLLSFIISQVQSIESRYGVTTDTVSAKLQDTYKYMSNPDKLREKVGVRPHCLDTTGFTIGMFLLESMFFKETLLNTVNAGGDADTNASVVGALIGAQYGIEIVPKDWREFSPAFQEAITVADRMCEFAA